MGFAFFGYFIIFYDLDYLLFLTIFRWSFEFGHTKHCCRLVGFLGDYRQTVPRIVHLGLCRDLFRVRLDREIRLHSGAERGGSPKLKIAKMAIFGQKTAFFTPKNDLSAWKIKSPGKSSRQIILWTKTSRLAYVSDSGCRGFLRQFFFKNRKIEHFHRGDPIRNLFFVGKIQI